MTGRKFLIRNKRTRLFLAGIGGSRYFTGDLNEARLFPQERFAKQVIHYQVIEQWPKIDCKSDFEIVEVEVRVKEVVDGVA